MSLISAIIGAFLVLRPDLAINLQIKFYELINWRIKPISMPKELRNTRIMGCFLIAASLVAIIYILLQKF